MNTEENMEVDCLMDTHTDNFSEDEDIEFIQKCRRNEIKYRRRLYKFEREKEIDLEIGKIVRKWLKSHRHFERVNSKSEATHLNFFQRSNLSQYHIIPKNKFNSDFLNIPYWFLQTKIYIKRINSY